MQDSGKDEHRSVLTTTDPLVATRAASLLDQAKISYILNNATYDQIELLVSSGDALDAAMILRELTRKPRELEIPDFMTKLSVIGKILGVTVVLITLGAILENPIFFAAAFFVSLPLVIFTIPLVMFCITGLYYRGYLRRRGYEWPRLVEAGIMHSALGRDAYLIPFASDFQVIPGYSADFDGLVQFIQDRREYLALSRQYRTDG